MLLTQRFNRQLQAVMTEPSICTALTTVRERISKAHTELCKKVKSCFCFYFLVFNSMQLELSSQKISIDCI